MSDSQLVSSLENTLHGRQKDEGHRGYAAIDQRYGEKTRYHAIRRASPRERHQDPPKGRRCQRYGKEMSTLSVNYFHISCRANEGCSGSASCQGLLILINHDLQICI